MDDPDETFRRMVAGQAAAEGTSAEARADAEALGIFYVTLKAWGVPVALCKELTTARQAGQTVTLLWTEDPDV